MKWDVVNAMKKVCGTFRTSEGAFNYVQAVKRDKFAGFDAHKLVVVPHVRAKKRS